jgi:hypothetical protein
MRSRAAPEHVAGADRLVRVMVGVTPTTRR